MAKIILRAFIALFSFIIIAENLLASEHPEDSLLGGMGGSAQVGGFLPDNNRDK